MNEESIIERLARESQANNPFKNAELEKGASVIFTNNPSIVPQKEMRNADLVIDIAKREIYKCRWADPKLMDVNLYIA